MRLKIVGQLGGKRIDSSGSDRSKPRSVLIATDSDVQLIDLDTGNPLTGVRGFRLFADVNDLVRVEIDLYPSEVQIEVEGAIATEPEEPNIKVTDFDPSLRTHTEHPPSQPGSDTASPADTQSP